MASISSDKKTGNRTLQFVGADRKRRSIRLGKMTKKTAETIRVWIERMNAAKIGNTPLDNETAAWLAKIGDDLYAKLARVGLVSPRGRSACITLVAYWKDFVIGKVTLKPRSVVTINQVCNRAMKFFGVDKAVADVTAGDAERFADWLRGEYAQATAARTLKRIKQLFARAVKDKVTDTNPFDDIRPGGMSNAARLCYVPSGNIARVIEAARNWEWRLVIALARFAGLRVPSELVGLTWSDVAWDSRRLVVHSPKLENSATGGIRVVPILPELLPHLREAHAARLDGELLIVPTLGRIRSGNLRTEMRRTIERAGLTPWERTFQNLRSSFVIDLHERFPSHVASRWAGHTDKVALAHYLNVQDAHFDRASGLVSAAVPGAVALRNQVQTVTNLTGPNLTDPAEVLDGSRLESKLSSQVGAGQSLPVVPA